MKSYFDDLEKLLEQAVASATGTEKALQKKQEKSVEKRGVKAKKEEDSDGVDEADDDDSSKKDSDGDESVKKLKGKPSDAPAVSKKPTDVVKDEIPGTKTSKKLADPSEKAIVDPKFADISNKINTLRGSGSLRDEKVSSAVKAYLGTLKPAERSALLTYLTNLAQIMSTVKSPKDVKDPSDIGIKTTFKKKPPVEKVGSSEEKVASEPKGVVVVGGK